MTRFDWAALFVSGVRDGGLSPDDFWGLTPLELMLILGRGPGRRPMSRDALEAMARAWPDEEPRHG